MSRNLKTFTFAMLAFALDMLLTLKLYVGVIAAVVVAAGAYFTWRPKGV